jgi:hypothetical protein
MYEGWRMNDPSVEWIRKTKDFIARAFTLSRTGTDVWCPCSMWCIIDVKTRELCRDTFANMATCLTMKSA